MKKLLVILTMLVLGISTTISAQTTQAATASSTVSISFMFLPIYMEFGDIKGEVTQSTVQIPEGHGTIKFNKRAGKFVDGVFTNAAGKSIKLVAVTSFSGNGPKPTCKSGETTGLYESKDDNITVSVCKTLPLADGSTPLVVSLVLPAVQAPREAGRSSN